MTFIESVPTSEPRHTPARVAVWGVGLLVGLMFVVAGLTKLLPGVQARFDQWGVPAWARLLVCAAEVTGGLLFCLPRAGAVGAGLLGALLASGVGVYFALRPDALPFPLVPLALLALVALVTWARTRLAWWGRYMTALDRYTAHEVGASGSRKV